MLQPGVRLDGEGLGGHTGGQELTVSGLTVAGPGVEVLQDLRLVGRQVLRHGRLEVPHTVAVLVWGGRAGGCLGGGRVGRDGGHGRPLLLLGTQSSVGGLHRCLE